MMKMPKDICPIYPGKGTLVIKHISIHCKLHKLEATCSPITRYYEEMKSMSTGDAYQFLGKKASSSALRKTNFTDFSKGL